MADPASLVGLVVGVTGLGIQACQIIHQYFSLCKSFNTDIQDVISQVQGIEGMLDALRGVKEKIEKDDHEPSSQLHMALGRCDEAARRLMTFASKFGGAEASQPGNDRHKQAMQKLLWPFRKDALLELRANLSDFQQNLTLAFQILGTDVVFDNITALVGTTSTIDDRTSRIEQHVIELSSRSEGTEAVLQSLSMTQQEQFVGVSTRMQVIEAALHSLSQAQQGEVAIGLRLLQIQNASAPHSIEAAPHKHSMDLIV